MTAQTGREIVGSGAVPGLTPLEVVASWPAGTVEPPSVPRRSWSPREAIEDGILRRSSRPITVAFSGGRDSSAILAIAVDLARRHGLPLPVPLTEVFPGDAASSEHDWQERVIKHLKVRDWCRIPVTQDGDLLGPQARASLQRHGVVWPPAVHVKTRLHQAARGTVLLTGEGGDEMLGASRNGPVRELAVEHRWRGRRHATALIRSVSSRSVRERLAFRALVKDDLQPWLKAEARETHLRRLAADHASEPFARADAIRWIASRRAVVLAGRTRRTVAADFDVDLVDPLLEPVVVDALAEHAGFWGWRGRTSALQLMVGDLLPNAVLDRRSKALFNAAYFGPAARAFAHEWPGAGLDTDLVDTAALRSAWLDPTPSALSFLPLQAAWLASTGS